MHCATERRSHFMAQCPFQSRTERCVTFERIYAAIEKIQYRVDSTNPHGIGKVELICCANPVFGNTFFGSQRDC
jgi:hypothetical protein